MPIQITHTPPNFLLAFIAAPLVGAVCSGVGGAVFMIASGASSRIIIVAPGLVLFSVPVCALYTLVLGGASALAVRRWKWTPSLTTALVAGILVGVGPQLAMLAQSDVLAIATEEWVWVTMAAFGSVGTAYTFWRLGLAGRGA